MSEEKISSNAAIDAALHLDGDPQNVKRYYADWARSYDRDVGAADYSGPVIAARLLCEYLRDRDARILDAGCGTGLVGAELRALGFDPIDGFDLSPEMAELSIATGAYRHVAGDIDIMHATRDYPFANYDALLCVGVFTLGHAPPRALDVLLQLLRGGGLLLASTRSHYYEQTDFQRQVDRLLETGGMSQLQVVRDAPYNHDSDAHYWVFRKSGAPLPDPAPAGD
jgi:predicted TPR repeat methyltransferase